MAEKRILELEVKTDKAISEIQGLRKEFNEFSETVADSAEKTTESVQGVQKASEDSAKGIKKLGAFVKASVVGFILVAFSKLKDMVMENQKAVDFFNTAFEAGSIVISDLINFLSNNYDKAVGFFKDVFEKPGEYVSKLGQLIKDNLTERFNSLLDVAGHLGKALKHLFAGEFEKAWESVKDAGVESLDVMSGVNNSLEVFTKAMSEAGSAIDDYASKTYDAAKANVELNKQAELALVRNQGLIEQYDRMAEQQRQLRDDETLSIEERIKANEELGRVLDEQEKLMKANAAFAVRAAKIQYDRDNQNVEAAKAYMEALNEQAAIEAQVTGFRSEQQTNEKSLQRELIELTQSRKEANEDLALSQKVFDAERIKDEVKKQEALKEIYAEEDAAKLARLEADIQLYNDGTQAKVDAEIAYEQFKEEARQREIESEEKVDAAKAALALKDKARKDDEIQREIEKVEAKRQLQEQQINTMSQFAGFLDSIAGKDKKVQKAAVLTSQAAAIAQIISNTAAANAKAVLASPLTAGQPWVGINTATAALSVAGIISTVGRQLTAISNSDKGGGAAGGFSMSSAPSAAPPAPPQISTVGSSGINQISEAINNRPIKAYVVSKDVSTAQEMDRNIVTQAGI